MTSSAFLRIFTLFLLLLALGKTPGLWAQKRPEIDMDMFILDLFQLQDEEDGIDNYDDIYEALYQLYRNPVNLNTAKRGDLEAVFILSELQINSLFEYRAKYGKLLSIYELQAVPHFDMNIIQKLLPFVEVRETDISKNSQPLWKRILNEKDNHYVIFRYNRFLNERNGYTSPDTNSRGELSSRYLGTPEQTYIRYRINHPQDFSLGFTMEKDAGERYFWNPSARQYGMDFISFHAYFENQGRWKRIALGDYQIGIGQNMLLTAGFAVGKGGEAITTVRRSNIGIRPYTSALESGFFRGAAATYTLNDRLDLTLFYSRIRRDATLQTQVIELDSLAEEAGTGGEEFNFLTENFIESVRATGLRRTPTELAARNTIREEIYGGNLLFSNLQGNFQAGATFMHIGYDTPLKRRDLPYNRFEFNGQENYNFGLNFNYYWQNFNFFGEAAQSKSGGRGGVVGFLAGLSPKLDMAWLFRHYDKDFHSFYGASFSEGSRPINETGFYWGMKARPIKKIEISAYYDQFSFPFLRSSADAPSEGYEYLLRVNYKINRKINLFAQFREESKELNQRNNTTPVDFLEPRLAQNYILNLSYSDNKILSLKSRLQINRLSQGNFYTGGYLLFQDVGFDLGNWKIDTRFAVFDDDIRRFEDDSFGSTFLYVYEKNVLWAPTLVRYTGRGSRWMVLLRYKVNRNLDVWARFAQIQLSDRDNIGSGLEQIQGNRLTQFTAQMRWQF